MKRVLLIILICIIKYNFSYAQIGKLHLGIQAGLTIPNGSFASGYGPYINNGYASVGNNYKIYSELHVKNTFYIGLSYINFTNPMEEGNLRNGFNNQFSTNNAKVIANSSTNGILGSILFKGTETPFFIKGFMGLGYSRTVSIDAKNSIESITIVQSTSDLDLITGVSVGLYVPIKNKWFIDLEASYISSSAKPGNLILKDNNSNESINIGSINYNQTVYNINLGLGIFIFRN